MFHEKQIVGMTFVEGLHYLGPKLLLALFCGGLIGLERELKSKAAGIKTNMLICVGSMLFTAMSIVMATSEDSLGVRGDPARLAAQIIPGIGFIGGGAILQSKGNVVGMTTAATIWLVAAIGVWIGMGQLEIALAVTLLILLVLVTVTFFEGRFLGKKQLFKITIHLREKTDEVTRTALEALLGSNDLTLEDYRESANTTSPEVRVVYLGRANDHSRLLLELWKIPGILDVKQS